MGEIEKSAWLAHTPLHGQTSYRTGRAPDARPLKIAAHQPWAIQRTGKPVSIRRPPGPAAAPIVGASDSQAELSSAYLSLARSRADVTNPLRHPGRSAGLHGG